MRDDSEPWWFPERTDAAWCEVIREDYPEDAHLSDEDLREEYANGSKYAVTWDTLEDALEQFEKLADAYLDLYSEVFEEHGESH